MTWLPVILITLTFGAFLPETNGKAATKKILFQNYELLDRFSEILVDQLINIGLINSAQETDVLDSLRELIEANQGKKVSTMKHAFTSKIADIIVEELEKKSDAAAYIDKATAAIETAFQMTIGVVDSNFIDSVNEMIYVMYNNDLEDELEEEQDTGLTESTQDTQQEQVLQPTTTTTTMTTSTQSTQTNKIQDSSDAERNQITNNNIKNENSQFREENLVQSSSSRSLSQASSASQVVSVNYQSIQSSFSSTLQSSSILSSLSSGILSSSDISRALESVLRSYGVQSGIVQSISSQYVASLGAGASTQTIISILSSIVSQALQRTGNVRPGQESSIGSSVAQNFINALQSDIFSRTRPAPQPVQRPRTVSRPLPAPISPVQPQTSFYSGSQEGAKSQFAAQSLASQSAQLTSESQSFLSQSLGSSENIDYSSSYSGSGSSGFEADSLYNSGGISSSSGFSQNASPRTSIPSSTQQLPALSKASSQLMSPAAAARISTLSGTLSSALAGGIDYASLSQAFENVAREIGRSSSLSQSEVVIEALLETLAALLELISPSPSGSNSAASQLAQSLIQVNA